MLKQIHHTHHITHAQNTSLCPADLMKAKHLQPQQLYSSLSAFPLFPSPTGPCRGRCRAALASSQLGVWLRHTSCARPAVIRGWGGTKTPAQMMLTLSSAYSLVADGGLATHIHMHTHCTFPRVSASGPREMEALSQDSRCQQESDEVKAVVWEGEKKRRSEKNFIYLTFYFWESLTYVQKTLTRVNLLR